MIAYWLPKTQKYLNYSQGAALLNVLKKFNKITAFLVKVPRLALVYHQYLAYQQMACYLFYDKSFPA
jgi:hypothetical protein